MVDLGLFNFIKNEIAKGNTKEQIVAQLTNGGHSPESIEAAYTAVINNTPPISPSAQTPLTLAHESRGQRPAAITAICFIMAVVVVLNLIRSGAILLLIMLNPLGIGILLALSLLIQILSFAVLYGYWMMCRWAVNLYGCIFVISLLLIAFSGGKSLTTSSGIISLIVSLIILGTGMHYFSEMS